MTSTLLLWHFWGSSFFQIKLPQFKLATPFPSSSSASSLSPGEPHSCSSDFLAGEALKQVLMLSLEHRGRQTDGKMIIYEQCRVISRHISVWRISNLIERASGRRREWDERFARDAADFRPSKSEGVDCNVFRGTRMKYQTFTWHVCSIASHYQIWYWPVWIT